MIPAAVGTSSVTISCWTLEIGVSTLSTSTWSISLIQVFGKSSFLVYFLLRAISLQIPVFITNEDEGFIFSKHGLFVGETPLENWTFIKRIAIELMQEVLNKEGARPTMWCLFDGITPRAKFLEMKELSCVVTSSPDEIKSNEHMRRFKKTRFPKKWRMNLLGWPEG